MKYKILSSDIGFSMYGNVSYAWHTIFQTISKQKDQIHAHKIRLSFQFIRFFDRFEFKQ